MAARFARGQFAFSREFTASPANRAATGDGVAEFRLGMASGGTIGNENGEDLWALFVQNDWKVSSRLPTFFYHQEAYYRRLRRPDAASSVKNIVPRLTLCLSV